MSTFTDLIENILIVLYQLKKKLRRTEYYSCKSILDIVKYPYSYSDIYQIAKYLEAEGNIESYNVMGDVFLQITTQGGINAEKVIIKEKSSDFINELDENKLLDKVIPVSNESIIQSRTESLEVLKTVQDKLSKSIEANSDAFSDIEIIRIELRKLNSNKEIILSKVWSLSQNPSVRHELRRFTDMLGLEFYKN